MPDSVSILDANSIAKPIGTEKIDSIDFQLVKLIAGQEGSVERIPGDEINGMDVDVTRLPALPAGTNNIGDVDVLTLPALPAGANNIGDVDVLTVPSDPFGADADAASATGSISAKLRHLAASGIAGMTSLPSGSNNIGDVDVLTLPALPAGTNNIGDVDVLTLPTLPAGTNNIGDVDVVTVPADPFGANADAASATGSISAKLRHLAASGLAGMTALPTGSNAIGKLAANSGVDIGDVDVTSVAGMPTGASATQVQGTAAAGAAAANNPMHGGVKGVDAIPAAVSANAIASQLGDLHGRTLVAVEAPNGALSVGSTATVTDTTITQVLGAAGASTKYRITAIGVYNSDATVGTWVKIQDDSGTPVVYWRGYAAPAGGGFNLNFSPALAAIGQANGKINMVCETTSAEVGVSVAAYKVPG